MSNMMFFPNINGNGIHVKNTSADGSKVTDGLKLYGFIHAMATSIAALVPLFKPTQYSMPRFS